MYLFLTDLVLHEASAHQHWLGIGLPSPTAIVGLAENISLFVSKELGVNVRLTIAPIIYRCDLCNHRSPFRSYMPKDPHMKKIRITVNPQAYIELDLVIKVEGCNADEFKEIITSQTVLGFLNRLRLAKSPIVPKEECQIIPDIAYSENELHQLLFDRPCHGFFIRECTEVLNDYKDDKADTLDALIAVLDDSKSSEDFENNQYIPVSLGYHLLEKPRYRKGARELLNHAYAEPLFGLVQCKYLFDINIEQLDSVFWSYVWKSDNYICTTQHKRLG